MLRPVFGRVTGFAVEGCVNKIAAAGNAFGSALKLAIGGGTLPRAEERTPADRGIDREEEREKKYTERNQQDFSESAHLFNVPKFRVSCAGGREP